MNQREKIALKSIHNWRGKYSRHWTPKTITRLQSLGYALIEGEFVRITMAGISALAELKD